MHDENQRSQFIMIVFNLPLEAKANDCQVEFYFCQSYPITLFLGKKKQEGMFGKLNSCIIAPQNSSYLFTDIIFSMDNFQGVWNMANGITFSKQQECNNRRTCMWFLAGHWVASRENEQWIWHKASNSYFKFWIQQFNSLGSWKMGSPFISSAELTGTSLHIHLINPAFEIIIKNTTKVVSFPCCCPKQEHFEVL